MKTNYTNQLQRDVLVGECNGNDGNGCFLDSSGHNCGCFKKISIQEQSISIEDRAKEYAEKVNGIYGNDLYPSCDETLNEVTIREFSDGAKSMLPIIKELGEALKEIYEANNGGTINTIWMGNFIQTTLDKYKQYL